jgi:hypothetical protein
MGFQSISLGLGAVGRTLNRGCGSRLAICMFENVALFFGAFCVCVYVI